MLKVWMSLALRTVMGWRSCVPSSFSRVGKQASHGLACRGETGCSGALFICRTFVRVMGQYVCRHQHGILEKGIAEVALGIPEKRQAIVGSIKANLSFVQAAYCHTCAIALYEGGCLSALCCRRDCRAENSGSDYERMYELHGVSCFMCYMYRDMPCIGCAMRWQIAVRPVRRPLCRRRQTAHARRGSSLRH